MAEPKPAEAAVHAMRPNAVSSSGPILSAMTKLPYKPKPCSTEHMMTVRLERVSATVNRQICAKHHK